MLHTRCYFYMPSVEKTACDRSEKPVRKARLPAAGSQPAPPLHAGRAEQLR